jgi:hypothetical protein
MRLSYVYKYCYQDTVKMLLKQAAPFNTVNTHRQPCVWCGAVLKILKYVVGHN